MNAPSTGMVCSANASLGRTMRVGAWPVPTGLMKMPVSGRIAARGVHLAGDQQWDRQMHGRAT
jgi:hypothetical protein